MPALSHGVGHYRGRDAALDTTVRALRDFPLGARVTPTRRRVRSSIATIRILDAPRPRGICGWWLVAFRLIVAPRGIASRVFLPYYWGESSALSASTLIRRASAHMVDAERRAAGFALVAQRLPAPWRVPRHGTLAPPSGALASPMPVVLGRA